MLIGADCRVGKVAAIVLTYCLSCFDLGITAIAATPTPRYHLLKKIALGGPGRWDYLTIDSAARRLYITRETRVVVMNVDTGQEVGEVKDTPGVHGVAIAPELGRGFTSNGRVGTATIFDLKTLQVLAQVKTGLNPDAIVYDPFSKYVFTFNGESNNATVFDARNAKVVGSIPLGGQPEFAVADGLGQIYVNLSSTNKVLTLNANSLKVKAQLSLAPCSQPTGIAMDRQKRQLFIGCRNRIMAIVDAAQARLIATLPIGSGVDANAFDQETRLGFSSNGEGTLTVVREDSKHKFSIVDNVVTQRGARTMALDTKTHNVFLATAQFAHPPTPNHSQPTKRPSLVPDSFVILVVGQ